jgi:hypothetical protein
LEFARQLATAGFRVVVVGRDEKSNRDTVSRLNGAGHAYLTSDLSSQPGVDAVLAHIEQDPPQILVNCAGVGLDRRFPDAEMTSELRMMAVNMSAPLQLSHAAIRAMRRDEAGLVVNVASTAGLWSNGTYSASKAWTIAFSLGISESLATSEIRAICVVPGFTSTSFFANANLTRSRSSGDWLWLNASIVASRALEAACRNQRIVIPTARYRLLVWCALSAPRWLRARIVARIGRAAGVIQRVQDDAPPST